MPQRRITLAYIIFYILFSIDTWRLSMGVILAALVGPRVTAEAQLTQAGEIMVWLMLTAMGWAVSQMPAKAIARFWRNLILGSGKKG